MSKTPTPSEPIATALTGTAKTRAAVEAAEGQLAAARARVAQYEADASAGTVDGHGLAAAEAECRLFARTVDAARKADVLEIEAQKRRDDREWALAQLPSILGHDVAVADAMDEVACAIDVLKSAISRRDSTIQMVAQGCHGRDTDLVLVDALGPAIDGYRVRLNHNAYSNYAAGLFAGVIRLGPSPQIAATLASMANQVPAPHRPDLSNEVLVGVSA